MKYNFMSIRSVRLAHWKNGILALAIFIFLPSAGIAMDVTLSWDANIEPDREGYRIYYDTVSGAPYEGGAATEGDSPIDVKIAAVETGDTARFTLTGLSEDEIYYFTLTAYNTRGAESGYSVEVSTAGDVNANSASASGGGGCFILTAISDK